MALDHSTSTPAEPALLQVLSEQRHVLHVGAKHDVESVAQDGHRTERGVEEGIGKQRDARRLAARDFDQETRRALHHYRRHGPLHGVDIVHQLKERQDAYHAQMRHELFLQRMAISERVKQRHAELSAPALEKHGQDRARFYQAVLAGQGSNRHQLHRDQAKDRRRPDILAANQNQAQMLTPDQVKAYKEHAISVAAQRAHYDHARGEVAPTPVRQDNGPQPSKRVEAVSPEPRGTFRDKAGEAERARARNEARMAEYQAEYRDRQSGRGRDRGSGRER